MTDKSLIISVSQILKKKSKNINTYESRMLLQKGAILQKEKELLNTKKQKKNVIFKQTLVGSNTKNINNTNITSFKLNELSISDNILLEHIQILKNQLELAGIKPIDDIITYEDAKEKLKQSLILASEKDSFENISEVERWDSFVTSHPKFILEKKNEEEQWKLLQNESITESLNIQKSIIPKDITNLSIEDLTKRNMTKQLANRIFRNKSLWLVHFSKEEISKLHSADLQYKFSNVGLDIIELKALYACLPNEFLFDHDNKKQIWKTNIIERLKELTNQEEMNKLPKKYVRNHCYLQSTECKKREKKDIKLNIIHKTNLFAELKSKIKNIS
tara:strand:+ start:835 stop:1830 length:996 start_codon:yes stop_codon:yes gene_type:complete